MRSDIRVEKTKKSLRKSFKEMFLEMDFEKITIKKLCERAMVNRRTFYLHYDSINDIMTEVLEEMALDFIKYTDSYDHFLYPDRIVRDYFIFTNNNPLYEKLNNNIDLNYLREQVSIRVVNKVTHHFDSIKYLDSFQYDMTRVFLNSTTVSMYRYWSINGKKIPMEDAINITIKLVSDGIKSIAKETTKV